MSDEHNDEYQKPGKSGKQSNVLPLWGNEQTMNLNPLILANIQGSSYFKVHLFKLKTYHEVVDEIYYQVKHLEPWERGSRKTAGQTGMCGGVRGVGAGGIVSTAYCLLYKLYTLRLTRKQVNGLMNHTDSPFIRALGFMYVRYTQPPADLFDWYVEYLEDAEEVDPKAGGGQPTTIGTLARQMLVKLDWFSTLFPRIPVPIQKQIEQRLSEHSRQQTTTTNTTSTKTTPWKSSYDDTRTSSFLDRGRDNRDKDRDRERERDKPNFGEAERYSRERNSRRDRSDRDRRRSKDRSDRGDRNRNRSDRDKYRDRSPSRNRRRR